MRRKQGFFLRISNLVTSHPHQSLKKIYFCVSSCGFFKKPYCVQQIRQVGGHEGVENPGSVNGSQSHPIERSRHSISSPSAPEAL